MGERERIGEFRADSVNCEGLLGLFSDFLIDDGQDEFTQRRLEAHVELLTGMFWSASELLIDELFEDLKAVQSDEGWDESESVALAGLPEQFQDYYTGRFVRQFIVAASVVSTRVATVWEYPATTAEALAVKLLLDHVTVLIETYEVQIEPGWRENVEGILFEDDDHEILYWSEEDVASHPQLLAGAVNLDIGDWFVPYRTPPRTAAYAAETSNQTSV